VSKGWSRSGGVRGDRVSNSSWSVVMSVVEDISGWLTGLHAGE
jgi:hypothetical protein